MRSWSLIIFLIVICCVQLSVAQWWRTTRRPPARQPAHPFRPGFRPATRRPPPRPTQRAWWLTTRPARPTAATRRPAPVAWWQTTTRRPAPQRLPPRPPSRPLPPRPAPPPKRDPVLERKIQEKLAKCKPISDRCFNQCISKGDKDFFKCLDDCFRPLDPKNECNQKIQASG